MLFFLPFRTNLRLQRTPYANYTLIIVNVIIFFLQYQINPASRELVFRSWVGDLMLTPNKLHWWQFISYAFLHGGLLHIIFNMFFLYLFGKNVNDKLGHFWYLSFYLAGAAFSAAGHTLAHISSEIPTLGASGAIAAVTGAYLVLFPQTLITVLYWIIFFIGTVEVPALYFIAIKMILIDNVIAGYTPNVAYDAHLAGYAFGIGTAILLLATGLISSSHFDLWAMIKQWDRRRRYRDSVSSGFDPFTGLTTSNYVSSKEIKKTAADQEKDQKIIQLRTEINNRIAQRNLPVAAQLYMELMKLDNQQVMPRQQLLDIANQLASEKNSAESARAYEQFLAHYAGHEYAEQVELMLGILYSRYLSQPQKAIMHLSNAYDKLTNPEQLKLCKDELVKLKK